MARCIAAAVVLLAVLAAVGWLMVLCALQATP